MGAPRRSAYTSRMADTRTGLPLVFNDPVRCPAGSKIGAGPDGSSGCHCSIEDSVILAGRDPGTLTFYCLPETGHQRCPTWQAEKERIAEGRRAPLTATAGSVAPGRVKVAGA